MKECLIDHGEDTGEFDGMVFSDFVSFDKILFWPRIDFEGVIFEQSKAVELGFAGEPGFETGDGFSVDLAVITVDEGDALTVLFSTSLGVADDQFDGGIDQYGKVIM